MLKQIIYFLIITINCGGIDFSFIPNDKWYEHYFQF